MVHALPNRDDVAIQTMFTFDSDAAAKKLDELNEASADRWEQVKEGVANAFADLKTIFE
ncbi:MAG: hypothetical protein R6V12_07455 [Candidatus Hydrogenedentota bacterium]